jgi:two-component system NtrC family sensor kinase
VSLFSHPLALHGILAALGFLAGALATRAAAVFAARKAAQRCTAQTLLVEDERNLLRNLIDSLPDSLYAKDPNGLYLVANRPAAQCVGVADPKDLIGKSDADFIQREAAKSFRDEEQKIIHSAVGFLNQEEILVDMAGTIAPYLTTKVPLRNAQGVIIGIAAAGRNMTERRKIEDARRKAEQNYRGMFYGALIGIFKLGPLGHLIYVNPAMSSGMGYTSPDDMLSNMISPLWDTIVSPERREEFMSEMIARGQVRCFEIEVYRKDRSKVWFSSTIRAVYRNRVLMGYEGLQEDITERRLLREQLAQAQKLESVGQLAAGIAHEINTPTQYIGDNVRFLKDTFLDLTSLFAVYEDLLAAARADTLTPKAIQRTVKAVDLDFLLAEIPRAIEQTLEGVGRVATLVSAMKEFSHPGTKEKIPLDLNHAIQSTLTVARNEWKYVADVTTAFDPLLPHVSCHPGEFNQVVLNLIVNAAHAIGDVVGDSGDKGTIHVQTRDLPGGIELRIGDTGAGIPARVRDRIFDPFFTTKKIGKGTGQGLAIAHSVIVDKHHGSIHFETAEGAGTTFVIRLPHDGQPLNFPVIAA